MTPTFTPPEVTRMRTYELMATPLVYSGQRVRARVIAHSKNAGDVAVSLSALVYGAGDSLAPLDSAGRRIGAERRSDPRLASARHRRTADPIARRRGAVAGRDARRRYRPRLASLGRVAGRAVAPSARTERLLASRLGERGRQFLDELPAGLPDFTGSRRRHDHSWRSTVARLQGGDVAQSSSRRTYGRGRSRPGFAAFLRGSFGAPG